MSEPADPPPAPLGPSRRIAVLRLAALALTLAALLAVAGLSGSFSAQRVRDWVDDYGAIAPVAFIAISSALTVTLFPGPVLAAASGLLFGTALGTPVSIIAATLGAVLAFSVSRWVAHDAVLALAGPRLLALRAFVGRRGFITVLYARIIPGLPYTLVNYAAGLTPMRLRAFAGATAIGVTPRTFAYVALGGSLGNLDSPEALAAIAVLVAMALGGAVLARREARSRPGAAG